jgi:arylsulfatase A-like enzyme
MNDAPAMVVTVRGLGARWLGAYGNEWVATPNLDVFASQSVVFERHHASLSPAPLRVASNIDFTDLLPPWKVNFEVFETYLDQDEPAEPVLELTDVALTRDDHTTWTRLHASFASMVTQFDAAFGRWMESVPSSTTIVVTADHGTPLGVHGIVGHETSAPFAELTHIPLMIRFAIGEHAGERVDALTTPDDLVAILRGKSPARERIITRTSAGVCLRTREWSFHVHGEERLLFQQPHDAYEVNDVARMHADLVAEFEALLKDGH